MDLKLAVEIIRLLLKKKTICFEVKEENNKTLVYKVVSGNKIISTWKLSPLPGNNYICISHGVFIYESFRKKRLGFFLNSLRISLAKELGYKYILCTHDDLNIQQTKILKKNNWKNISNLNYHNKNIILSIKKI